MSLRPKIPPRFQNEAVEYDAILVLSFGGPESMDEVIPFMENVTTGRGIPRKRLEEVSEHYKLFNGVSPLNEQNRQLIAALETELQAHNLDLPVYWGNRNWHPFLTDTLRQMQADGVKRVLTFITSMYSSYSGCRQYRENIADSLAEVGEDTLQIDRMRFGFNHPLFIEANIENVQQAYADLPAEHQTSTKLIFSAHSIPIGMADRSAYEAQLRETCRLVAEGVGVTNWELVYQSRSGPPQVPWLEPDICDYLETVPNKGYTAAVLVPIGFISDHMEVLYDLDTEAMQTAENINLHLVRVPTVGIHPKFIQMIRELIVERITENSKHPALGYRPPNHDICPANCCLIR